MPEQEQFSVGATEEARRPARLFQGGHGPATGW